MIAISHARALTLTESGCVRLVTNVKYSRQRFNLWISAGIHCSGQAIYLAQRAIFSLLATRFHPPRLSQSFRRHFLPFTEFPSSPFSFTARKGIGTLLGILLRSSPDFAAETIFCISTLSRHGRFPILSGMCRSLRRSISERIFELDIEVVICIQRVFPLYTNRLEIDSYHE